MINPLRLLCASTVLGTSGLLLLGSTSSAALMWIAVTIYGFGKTFLWPTMLGVVVERFPRGGAVTMGAIGAAGALSGGLLGGPGIGYEQDVNATAQLKKSSAATYERYMAPNENGFLFFPKVRGLDGQKAGVLLESNDDGWAPATTLDRDYRIAAGRGDIPDDLQKLKTWWDDTGQPNSSADKDLVAEARMFGGQMALKLTAAVPALMFVGYLLLVLHFRAQGGYRTVELSGESTREPGD